MRFGILKFTSYILALAIALFLLLATTTNGKANDQQARVDKLNALAKRQSDGLITFNSGLFRELLGVPNRPYWVVALFTAMGKDLDCRPCRMVDEPIRSISRYWKKNGQDDRLYFATIDAGTSSDIFEKLQLDNVPRLIAFPADIGQFKGSHKYPREINIVALKFDADAMAEQLSEELGVKLGTDVPFDYTKPLMYLGIVVVGGYVVYQLYQNLMRGGLIKSIAGVLSIVFILMMSSGYMWGKINQAPYIGASRGGEPSLFSPGNQIQFGIETQIVSALYALCAISVVGLTVHVPKIQNQERRTFMIFVWLIVLISTYSYLNVVFRIKIPSYPYRLLLP